MSSPLLQPLDGGPNCGVHEQMIRSLAEGQTRMEDKIDFLVDAERARAIVCAQQCEKVAGLEKDSKTNKDDHRDLWSAVNVVRRHIYIGIGAAAAIQFLLLLWMKGR